MKGINFEAWQQERLKYRELLNGKSNIYRTESLGGDGQKNLTPYKVPVQKTQEDGVFTFSKVDRIIIENPVLIDGILFDPKEGSIRFEDGKFALIGGATFALKLQPAACREIFIKGASAGTDITLTDADEQIVWSGYDTTESVCGKVVSSEEELELVIKDTAVDPDDCIWISEIKTVVYPEDLYEIITIQPNSSNYSESIITYSSENILDFTNVDGESIRPFIVTSLEDVEGTTINILPAEAGVIIQGHPGDYAIKIYDDDNDPDSVEGTVLVGTATESASLTSDSSYTYYILNVLTGNFEEVSDQAAEICPRYRAYIKIEVPVEENNSSEEENG